MKTACYLSLIILYNHRSLSNILTIYATNYPCDELSSHPSHNDSNILSPKRLKLITISIKKLLQVSYSLSILLKFVIYKRCTTVKIVIGENFFQWKIYYHEDGFFFFHHFFNGIYHLYVLVTIFVISLSKNQRYIAFPKLRYTIFRKSK